MPPRSGRRPGEPHADLPGEDPELSGPRRRISQAHPRRGWRTLWSRAHASRVYHPSSPVPVRRPAPLDGASSRRPRAMNALALLRAFGSAHPWHGGFHPVSSVPGLAHTLVLRRRGKRASAFRGRPPRLCWVSIPFQWQRPGSCSVGYFLLAGAYSLLAVKMYPFKLKK